MTRRLISTIAIAFACVIQAYAQISVRGYSLVYSSETPERAASLLDLSDEELANCSGDFMSTKALERHWNYSKKASSTWNKRMGTTAAEHAMVHKVEDGHLHMLAVTKDGTADGFITSGVNMKQGFKYGIFEIKAKCNPHKSNFPAIWMMPVDGTDGWPNCGEIDIMEQIGTSSTVWSTVHLGARYDKPVGKNYAYSGNMPASDDWHVYSLRWTRTSLVFYCDGIQVFRYNKDATLDLDAHPDYEKWQFPYNKEFYVILDQALGMNTSWGSEEPDPTFTYEMDVEYVRIWQAPENYEADSYYTLSNYKEPTRYMAVAADGTLTTTEVSDPSQLTSDMIFGFVETDTRGKYYILTYSGQRVGYLNVSNKAVPLDDKGYPYYMIKDDAKGIALDHAMNTAPFNYSDGSRALSLNTSRNNAVTISGTAKSVSWWTLHDATDLITALHSPSSSVAPFHRPRKMVRNNRLVIVVGDKEYTPTGIRIKVK